MGESTSILNPQRSEAVTVQGMPLFAEPALEQSEGLRMTPGGLRAGALLVTGGIALAGSLISDA
jgi:hypothetical protein